jgi:hypothetical protein
MDHRADFELLVMKKLGAEAASQIDWSGPRLVCVASDFTRYDEHAIGQINRSIELVRYRDHGGAFLTFDLVASTSAKSIALEAGFTRDMSKIGHFGTGDLEVCIGSHGDFERAQPFIVTQLPGKLTPRPVHHCDTITVWL